LIRPTSVPAEWAAAHIALDDPAAVSNLLDALREAGASAQVSTLASRAVVDPPLDDPADMARLLTALQRAAATDQVTILLARAPLDNPDYASQLLTGLRRAGAASQVIAPHTPIDVSRLLDAVRERAAMRTATTHAASDTPIGVSRLLDAVKEAYGDDTAAHRATYHSAAEAAADHTAHDTVSQLLTERERLGPSPGSLPWPIAPSRTLPSTTPPR
jgi:hypothetical protein